MFPAGLLLIGSLACVISGSLAACPPPEYVVPCYCALDALFCRSAITTAKDLERIMYILMARGTFKVELKNQNLGNMSLPTFKVVYITELKISDSKLESIIDPTSALYYYAASYTLKVLKITNSIDTTTNQGFRMNLMSLRALKELDIFGNTMKKVGNDLFIFTPETVTSISLVDNKIETLEDGTFDKFLSLEVLKLDKNKIATLTRSILPSSPIPLRLLTMSNNPMTSLSPDLFYRMHFLSEVDISNTKIAELTERPWSSIWSNIDRLNAKGIELKCESTIIGWMFKISHPKSMEADCKTPAEKTLGDVIEEEKAKTMFAPKIDGS